MVYRSILSRDVVLYNIYKNATKDEFEEACQYHDLNITYYNEIRGFIDNETQSSYIWNSSICHAEVSKELFGKLNSIYLLENEKKCECIQADNYNRLLELVN